MAKNCKFPSWRIMTAMIMDAARKDPQVLLDIYEDAEFRPVRNANSWAQLSAILAKERKAYREAVAGKSQKEVQHTMLRRCFAHDYSVPGSYMITLVVPERGSNPFGEVRGDIAKGSDNPPHMEPSALGSAMLEALSGITVAYPMVTVHKAQLMPDHLHLILTVSAPIVSSTGKQQHLGQVIAGYKKGCNRAYWDILGLPSTTSGNAGLERFSTGLERCPTGVERFSRSKRTASNAATGRSSVWAKGYTDTIINSRRHMAAEEAYLDDNPRRLRMKQLHRDLLRTVHHIVIDGNHYAALGNINLLSNPWKEQVQFHHWEMDVPEGFLPCTREWHCRRFYRPAGEPQDTTAHPQDTTAHPQDTAAHAGTTAHAGITATVAGTTAAGVGRFSRPIFTIGERIIGSTQAEAHTARLLKAADQGAVLVSPFISDMEKAVRNAALTMGMSYIRLTREGFTELFTPTKAEFEACCEGRLLILAPWEDRHRTATITRAECMALNRVAQSLAQGAKAKSIILADSQPIQCTRDE